VKPPVESAIRQIRLRLQREARGRDQFLRALESNAARVKYAQLRSHLHDVCRKIWAPRRTGRRSAVSLLATGRPARATDGRFKGCFGAMPGLCRPAGRNLPRLEIVSEVLTTAQGQEKATADHRLEHMRGFASPLIERYSLA